MLVIKLVFLYTMKLAFRMVALSAVDAPGLIIVLTLGLPGRCCCCLWAEVYHGIDRGRPQACQTRQLAELVQPTSG